MSRRAGTRSAGLALSAALAAASTAVLLALPALAAPSAPAGTPAVRAARVPGSFVLGGGGFGHGVGMSQYGAQAQALAGRSAAQILAGYYTGTTVTAVRDDADIRVQILGDVTSTRITAGAVDELGGWYTIAVGRRALKGRLGDRLAVATSGAGVRATLTHAGRSASIAGSRLVVRWQGTREMAGPATVVRVQGASATYRWGRLEITNILGLLNVVDVLRLRDEYLNGIDEVPASWAPAALQAQAIAARTYAIKAMAAGVYRWCDCHVYDDTRSQVFHGWSRQAAPGSGPRWTAAVRATTASRRTGRVVTYRGAPIDAVYFSSDGGHTENSEDVWSTVVPYLRGVPDPWSAGAGNPLATWSRTRSQAQVAAAFGLSDVVSLDLSDRTAGGGVRVAVATSSAGVRSRISGASLENRLGLPSWWVARPAERVAGRDRWATALAGAALVTPKPPTRGGTVVVAGGQPLTAEAAVAAPLAHHLHAPLLLVARDAIPAAVAAHLAAHPPDRVVVVGGPDSVSDAVVTALAAPARTVTRIAGADRYATSALVALQIGASAGFAVVAPGDDAALATTVAAAAVAAAADRPLFLVPGAPTKVATPSAGPSATAGPSAGPSATAGPSAGPSATAGPSTPSPSTPGVGPVPPAVAAALRALGVRGTACVGSAAELPEVVCAGLPGCTRVAGTDPAGTAAALARAFDRTITLATVAVTASGPAQLTDALAAAAVGFPVLYAGRTAPAASVALLQGEPAVSRIVVLGGAGGVPDAVVAQLRRA